MSTFKIEEVEYKKDTIFIGNQDSGFDYKENIVTFSDDSKEVRMGITRIDGRNIQEMAESLMNGINHLDHETSWLSLQATSLNELKAAHRVGFRNIEFSLSSLEEHINQFQSRCGTLHVELFK